MTTLSMAETIITRPVRGSVARPRSQWLVPATHLDLGQHPPGHYPYKWLLPVKIIVQLKQFILLNGIVEPGVNSTQDTPGYGQQVRGKGNPDLSPEDFPQFLLNFRCMAVRGYIIGFEVFVYLTEVGTQGQPSPGPGNAGLGIDNNRAGVDQLFLQQGARARMAQVG